MLDILLDKYYMCYGGRRIHFIWKYSVHVLYRYDQHDIASISTVLIFCSSFCTVAIYDDVEFNIVIDTRTSDFM